MARGGGVGSGFAQGLSAVLTQGLPVLVHQRTAEEKLRQDEEELKVRKKLVEAQAEHLQVQAAKGLREALVLGQLGQTFEGLGTEEVPPPVGRAEQEGSTVQPSARGRLARMLAEAGHPKEALGLFPELGQDPSALEDRLRSIMGIVGGGSAGGVTPAGAGAIPGAPGPAMTFRPTINLDKQGNVSVSIAGQPTSFDVKHFQTRLPDGREQFMQGVWDPAQGRWVTPPEAVGSPAFPEAIQRYSTALSEGYGFKPGTPIHGAALGEMLLIQALPDSQKGQAIEELDTKLRRVQQHLTSAVGAAVPPDLGAPDVAGVRGRAALTKAAETEQEARARERGTRSEQALQGVDRAKYEMLLGAERQTELVASLFRPEFVGKGFSVGFTRAWNQQEGAAQRGRYVPGGVAGALREWFGSASPEEIQFRRATADVADQILRARSGAQINEREYERLKRMLFRVTDEPATFLPALSRFREEVGRQIDDVLETGTTSAGELLKRRQPRPPAGGTATLETFPEAMVVQDPAGKPYRLEPGERLPAGWKPVGPYPKGRR